MVTLKTPEISIVIRTYNEAKLLPRTLEAIMEQTEQCFEIVLVDSGSTDTTLEIARCYDKENIVTIPKHELTYSGALNIVIAAV